MLSRKNKRLAERSLTFLKFAVNNLPPLEQSEDLLHIHKVNLICIIKPYTQLSYPRLSKLYEAAHILGREESRAFEVFGV